VAALTADVERRMSGGSMLGPTKAIVIDGTYYKGALLSINTAGFYVKATNTLPFGGIVAEHTEIDGGGGYMKILRPDWAWIDVARVPYGDRGADFMATTDNDISVLSGAGKLSIGRCHDVRAGVPGEVQIVFAYVTNEVGS